MAVVGPVLVSDQTNTGGTGSLSLNNVSSDGRRGLADAVSNGDAANSDTVHYLIQDSGTSGSSLDFEKGKGTVSDDGATLSRDTVYQSSNSGNKVSWPAGGTRDVIIAVGIEDLLVAANNLSDLASASTARANLDVPGLSVSNTFSESQVVRKDFLVARTDTARAGIRATTDRKTNGLVADYTAEALSDADANVTYGTMRFLITDPTDGAEDASWAVRLMSGGTRKNLLNLASDGSLTDSPGNTYLAVPSGAEILSDTVFTGYTRQDETDGRLIKLAESGDTLGATGGTDDVFDGNWDTNTHTLTISEIPSHDHDVSVDTDGTGTGVRITADLSADADGTASTNSAGGNGSHSHNMTTPAYRIMGRIKKD